LNTTQSFSRFKLAKKIPLSSILSNNNGAENDHAAPQKNSAQAMSAILLESLLLSSPHPFQAR